MATKKPSVGIFLARPDRTFHMARKLRERGFEIVHYNTGGYENDPYVRLRGGPIAVLAYLLRRTHHDLYFTSLGFVPSFWLYLNKCLRGKRYVYNATGVKWETFRERSSKKLFSRFFEHQFYPFLLDRSFAGASRIVCNSHFLEATLKLRYPQYEERFRTIYNGIDFEKYAPGQRRSRTRGDLILLCTTALNFEHKSQGLRVVIEAFDRVRAVRKNVKLLIAAKTANPVYQKAAEDYLNSKPWKDAITLVCNHRKIPDFLTSGDIFVYATPNNSNDSLPRSILEAQSAGLPVVTTDTSGCPEIVRHGKSGFVVPYEAGALADRILQLIDNRQLRFEMGRMARERILQVFNWDEMADRYAELFFEVIGEKQAESNARSISRQVESGS
jgi:glycosyltransferase involved in cell wall biosynthesis